METLPSVQITNWSQIGMQEYLLIVRPDADVAERILIQKKEFTGKYFQKAANKTQPYISIANFLAREQMEETIIRYTQRICSQQVGFNVELNNYSGVPPHTIFLRIQNPQPFKKLANELKVISNYVTGCSCPPVTVNVNPHLTIARGVPETLYLEAMMDYSQKTFHEIFMVNELVLLRRNHQYDTYKTVQVFHLQPPDFKPFENTLFN